MKVLMISTDRNIFKQSQVRTRMIEYGNLFDELKIVIYSTEKRDPEKISDKVIVYSTNSSNKLVCVFDAIKVCRSFKEIDVVTTQDPFETGMAGYNISKKLNAKFHVQIHTDFLSPYFKNQSVLNRTRVGIARTLLPKADGIRVVSERIKESIKDFNLKVEPVVLPIYFDSGKFIGGGDKVRFDKFEKEILTVSRLESEKRVSLIIDALHGVFKKHPKTGLVIVGDGSRLKFLVSKVHKLGLGDNVRFTGPVENTDEYYRGADIYVQTSLYEGFGLSLFEAALSGLPIVTTDVGLVGSIIDVSSVSIVGLNKENIADKLSALIENDVLSKDLGQKAKDDAKRSVISKSEYLEKYKKSLEL